MNTTPSPPSAREMEPQGQLDDVQKAFYSIEGMLRRFEATCPTPLNRPGESTMVIEHHIDLCWEVKQGIAALKSALARREQPADGGAVSEAMRVRCIDPLSGRELQQLRNDGYDDVVDHIEALHDALSAAAAGVG